jgi:hypothetical protein
MGSRSRIAAGVVLLGLGFGYGFLCHRGRIFPYDLIHGLFGHDEAPPVEWVDGFGKARPVPRNSSLTAEQQANMENMSTLGYLGGTTPAGELVGITRHDPERAFDGLNLVIDGHRAQAELIDMRGQRVHKWQYEYHQAFPDAPLIENAHGQGYWRRVALLDDGSLVGIYEGQGIVKLDRDSKLLWAVNVGAHHDLEVQPDGSIYFLERHEEILPRVHPANKVLHDSIVVLDKDGVEIRRVSILEAVESSNYYPLLRNRRVEGVLFHTNTLEVLDGSLADAIPAFRAGNVLLSLAKIDAICVLNMEGPKIEWALADLTSFQHQPTLLPNGRLLVFDNSGDHEHSRVIEVDPRTQQIAWSYAGGDPPLNTPTCGSAQRLPNGNTLITESEYGRALEVTSAGETVWEYYTPHRAGDNGELVAILFEVVRIFPPPAWLPE